MLTRLLWSWQAVLSTIILIYKFYWKYSGECLWEHCRSWSDWSENDLRWCQQTYLCTIFVRDVRVNGWENIVCPDQTTLIMICTVVCRYTYIPYFFKIYDWISAIFVRDIRINACDNTVYPDQTALIMICSVACTQQVYLCTIFILDIRMNSRIMVCSIVSRYTSGPGCSKLTTSLVNETLKFQTLISQIFQYFLLKNCEKLLQCRSFSHFLTKNFSVFGYKVVKHLTSWPLNELVKLTMLWTTGPCTIFVRIQLGHCRSWLNCFWNQISNM